MNQQTMITICEARPSQSGKTLGIKDQAGQWYSTKNWELQNMVGQAIYAETSASEFNGKLMHWINEYTVPDGTSQPPQTVPGATYTQAGGQPQQAQAPQALIRACAPPVNRDASIVAQTLCKTVTFNSYQEAWKAYTALYAKYQEWASQPDRPPQAESEQVLQAQQAQAEEYSDDIPF